MSVKVIIPEAFYVASGGLDEIETHGKTVGDCLAEAAASVPALRQLWFTPEGSLSKYVLLCLNGENIPAANLDRATRDGDEIMLLLVVGGG
jgi:molybdopterin converting factor small subunit